MSWIDAAAPLIQQFEGLAKQLPDGRIAAYPDPATGGDPWTIGWGTTGPTIKKGVVWTLAECEAAFRRDVEHFGNGVEHAIDGAATSDRQMAAMVSLAYNIGLGNFRSSTLLRKHRAGDYAGAKAQFAVWNKANKKVMAGLTRRRAVEAVVYGKAA